MDVLFKGMVHVSGTHDSGKSTLAQECGAKPLDMAFVDADIKGRDFAEQLKAAKQKLGFYRDMVSLTANKKEVETHNLCVQTIADIEETVKTERKGKPFEALIWDTWTPFELTFHPFVMSFPQNFRTYWSPNGLFKGAEQWKSAFKYESEVINKLLGLANMVILTSHLKPHAINGHKTGKMVPDCKQPVIEKAMLRLYLMPSSKGPQPSAIVLKRIAKSIVTEDGIRTISVLPRRMEPCTWDAIRGYWKDPVGNRALRPEEKPNEFELSVLDDVLTDEQKMILQLAPVAEDEEEISYSQETIDNVKRLKAEGKPNPVIAKQLEMTVADVAKIISTVGS